MNDELVGRLEPGYGGCCWIVSVKQSRGDWMRGSIRLVRHNGLVRGLMSFGRMFKQPEIFCLGYKCYEHISNPSYNNDLALKITILTYGVFSLSSKNAKRSVLLAISDVLKCLSSSLDSKPTAFRHIHHLVVCS